MKSTRDRLEELERADFDTFGEQDKGPGEWPLATPEEVEAISEAFYDHIWEDSTRYPEAFPILWRVVASIAVGEGSAECCAHEATQALRRVMRRVLRGEEQAEVYHRHG